MSTTTTLTPAANGATATSTALKPAVRPYRDYLTPCLHRLFTNAALVGLVACYVASVLMSPWSLFWSWFPLGPTGARASLLFISVLCVFILRIANLRVAARQASSSASDLVGCLFTKGAYKTLVWYMLSSFLFCETYIHSTDHSKELNIVDSSKPYERSLLNERPIVLRTSFLLLAVWQTGYHLYRDLDQVKGSLHVSSPPDPIGAIRAEANEILQHATRSMMLTPIPAFFAYTLFLRRTIWSCTFTFSRSIFSNLPKYQKPSTIPPFLGDLIFLYMGWGWVLVAIWGVSNAAFNAFLAQAPLDKKHRPLSSGSKDPNGTLLNGLRSRKEFATASAFAELALIVRDDAARRQTFFKELDRTGGSTWSQLVIVCLGQLQGVSKRIVDFTNPISPTLQPVAPEMQPGVISHLPHIAPPLKQADVYANAPPPRHPHIAAFGSFAKVTGSHPGAQYSISLRARNVVLAAVDRVLTPEQQQAFSESSIAKMFRHYWIEFVKLPYIGAPFRQTFARRVSAVVIGEPASGGASLRLLSNAITSLAQLVVCASTEDPWGKAHKDVATIMRTYSATISTIEDFTAKLKPHWTDVDFSSRKAPEVEELVRIQTIGLKIMLEAYEGYSELGLTYKERRIAREKTGMGKDEADPFISEARGGDRVEMRELRRRNGANA